MHIVRINNITVQVKGQHVFLLDVFGDTDNNETQAIVNYLISEGFVNSEEEIHVFIKSKPFIPGSVKKKN